MKQARNSIMHGASGALGAELLFRQRGGRTFISLPPAARPDNPTVAQQARRRRFKQAVRYARMVIADPALKEMYHNSVRSGANAYNTAIRDCLTAPVIAGINMSGHIIRICADDDFKVRSVRIAVFNAANELLEEGPAIAEGNNCWRYTVITDMATLTGGRISVEVSDLPGNVSRKEMAL